MLDGNVREEYERERSNLMINANNKRGRGGY
jgi:hypothetical protein